MKKILGMLMVVLVFGTASAQVNKTDPPRAITSPGTPPIENATQEINRQQARQVQATSLSPAASGAQNTSVQPVQRESKGSTTTLPSGGTLAYPAPQGVLQPGTGTSTAPTNGTNNPTTTLPGSNTTNQGKVP